MIKKSKKKNYIIIPLVIISLMIFTCIYFIFFKDKTYVQSAGIVYINIDKNELRDIYYNGDVMYGINMTQYNDIKLHPENYKEVSFNFEVKNNLKLNNINLIEFNALFDTRLKNNILGYTKSGDFEIDLKPSEIRNVSIECLIKTNSYNTDELNRLIKRTKFNVNGCILGVNIKLKTVGVK